MRDLNGRRALITGGAGGIGRAIGAALASRGAVVHLADLDEMAAVAAAAAITGASGHAVDVTDTDSVARLREEVRAQGPLDVLINNAGIVHGGELTEVALEQHRATIDVNLTGFVAMTRAFLGDLKARPEAHIVNIVSASAFLALPYASTYAASKWGALGFSESLRHELKATGAGHVGVSAICPAYVDTGMFEGAQAPPLTRFLTPERLAAVTARAIERNQAVVRTPWTTQLTRLAGILPTWAFDAVAGLFGISTSMRDWRGHDRA